VLKNDEWTREETEYLFSLCRDYDLRFPIIWDRYEWPGQQRTLEDLKSRYYGICRGLMELRKPMGQMTPEETHMLSLLSFDKERETARRLMAERQFNKTEEEVKEEEMLLAELKRIVMHQEHMVEERRDLFQRLSFPKSNGSIAAYTGSQGLTHLRDMMISTSDKNKKRKSTVIGQTNGGETAQQTPTSAGFTDRGGSGSANNPKDREGKEAKRQVKKLTPEEELLYGVSHHEKLSAGVKLRSHLVASSVKGASLNKINQALTQLGIAPKLTLPTAKTVEKYEQLQGAIGVLLDCKKLVEKVEQEIRVLTAQKDNMEIEMES
jgi:DNA methyltransferase 1-associated protein 1